MRFLVDLHTHTIASDHAYSTIMDYFNYAAEIGVQMFACTDHGPAVADAPHKWHFKNMRVVPHIVKNVAMLRGVEANIMPSGGLDIEDSILSGLDIVLAGFHPNYMPTTREEHTRLMLDVIASGKVDVIAHPGNPNYPIDLETVLTAAKEHQVAIEINSSSSVNTRMGSHDNCVKVAKLAKKIGNIISLGTDAHFVTYMANFTESLQVLKEADMGYDQVINTSPAKVLDFLESRGHAPIKSLRAFFTPFS